MARRGGELAVALAPGGDRCAALEAWFRRRAREWRSPPASTPPWPAAGTAYATLQIRGQRTRWASCSTSGAMSFNWRLLLAPPEILDYVVEHEVAHLEIHDHSERFWESWARRAAR